jgi:hypothetical protein
LKPQSSFLRLRFPFYIVDKKIKSQSAVLFEVVESQLLNLIEYYAFLPTIKQKIIDVYTLLCKESLSGIPQLPYTGFSKINDSGLPFQWSFSFSKHYQPSLRFICEAGRPNTSARERFIFSLNKIKRLNEFLGIPTLEWLEKYAITTLIPSTNNWPATWKSAMWFALGANSKGILYKVYFNLNQGDIRERWLRIGNLLKSMNRIGALEDWCNISAKVSLNSIPVGVALDVLPDGNCGRIKVYFRSASVKLDWLEKWYHYTDSDKVQPAIRHLIEAFPYTQNEMYPDKTFFVSWETEGNQPPTLKTEIAVTNVGLSESEVLEGTYAMMNKLDFKVEEYRKLLSIINYSEELKDPYTYHKFIGIGYEQDGSIHLNSYIHPVLSEVYTARKTKNYPGKLEIANRLKKAQTAIFNSLTDNEKWIDYNLPVGKSDVWVSSFILFHLRNAHLSKDQQSQYISVQNWLVKQLKFNGWGYNSLTPADTDSTSLALLTCEISRDEAIQLLRYIDEHCKLENGFSTYSNEIYQGKWSEATDDVSPYVLLAKKRWGVKMDEQDLVFIRKNQNKRGSWKSYWWATDLYSIYGYLQFQNNAVFYDLDKTKEYLNNYVPSNNFERALLVLCLIEIKSVKSFDQLIKKILDDQLDSGLWEGSAILKLPDSGIDDPENRINGTRLFKDENGLFTTAVVMNALEKYLDFTSHK